MILATTSAGCVEMQKLCKIGYFIRFGGTGESPNAFKFYFQHNNVDNFRLLQRLRLCCKLTTVLSFSGADYFASPRNIADTKSFDQ